MWGGRKKSGWGVSWTTSQSFRHQRRPVEDCSPGRGKMAQDGGTRGGTFHGEMDLCSEKSECICFVFVFLLVSLNDAARSFVQSSFVLRHAYAPPRLPHMFLPLLFFCSLVISLFPGIFVPLPFSLCMESTSYVFPFWMVFSTLWPRAEFLTPSAIIVM